MSSAQKSGSQWGHSYRLIASEKWKIKSAAMGRDATHALVDYARPQAGMQVLDLASGTGEPAITLASRIGPEGHVVALDLSPELLQIAEERGRERHLTNLTTRQADANNLPFPDQSFDLITSRFGVMFLDEDALREACRVLRPSSRACFLAWGVRAAVLVKHDGSGTQTGRWHFGPSGSRSIQVFAARQPLRRIAPRRFRASRRRDPDCPVDMAGNCRRSLGASARRGHAVPSHVRARSARKMG